MVTSKSIAGILFILLLLTDKSVLKEILKFRTLLLFAAWLVFCYPLADADYMAKTGRGDIELLEIVILKLCRG